MKFICTQENLNKGLTIVNHIANKNTTLPILNNVLLKTEDGILKLSTTNLEIGMNCIIRGKVEKEGSFTVQAKLISDYINLLPKEQVELELKGNALHIKCGKHETKINGLSADDFPVIPELPKQDVISLPSKDFRKAISQVIFAVANDDTRPEISGVYFIFNGEELIMVGTDSYRLAEKRLKLKKGLEKNRSVIIPARSLQELARTLTDGVQNDQIELVLSDNQIMFNYNSVELVSRLIEGQYPDYKQILLDNFKTTFVLPTSKFVNIIKSASLFCKIGINDVSVRVLPTSSEVIVSSSNSQLGEHTAKIEADIVGEPNEIVFNYRYLLDGLAAVGDEEIEFKLLDENTQGMMKSKASDDYQYVIMPVILS